MVIRLRSLAVGSALALALAAAPASAHTFPHGDPLAQFVNTPAASLRVAPTRALADLATSWCGSETSGDLPAPASLVGADFKFVYAHAAGTPDHFARYASLIQGDARWAASALAASGGGKAIRFDLGTACGPQYLDIASVTLPHRDEYYTGTNGDTNLARVERDVSAAIGTSSHARNVVVYADNLPSPSAGAADLLFDDQPGADNLHNSGGLTAVLWGRGGPGFIDGLTTAGRRAAVLHEIGHLLGAVQLSAPHSTGAGHCTDGWDVMCYADGGPHNHLTFTCAGGSTTSRFDCGQDDYFNPAPAPGSYLATHWNTYDSRFLCPVASCGSGRPAPVASLRLRRARRGRRVTLIAAGSSGSGGIVDYSWDLPGSSGFNTHTGRSGRLTLKLRAGRAGVGVKVQVRVQDAAGDSAVTTRTVTAPRVRAAHARKA